MSALFRLPAAVPHDPAIDAWFANDWNGLRQHVRPWFERLRGSGGDVRECLHDGQPTACIGDAAFAYVGAYNRHASIGFFHGADLDDPAGLLEGAGKAMRHVKLRWGAPVPEAALVALLDAAARDVRRRLADA